MKKIVIAVFVFGLFIYSFNMKSFAGENMVTSPNAIETSIVSEKLDRILQAQDQILSDLDNIKAELEIVKIRASQR